MSFRLFSPGGTPGGLVPFLAGLAMAVSGGYMLSSRVQVTSGYWGFHGVPAFGLTMLPLIVGIFMLFFNSGSRLGFFLLYAGLVVIFTGILMNLHIYFQSTTLYETLVMLVLLVGGVALVLKSLKSTA